MTSDRDKAIIAEVRAEIDEMKKGLDRLERLVKEIEDRKGRKQ